MKVRRYDRKFQVLGLRGRRHRRAVWYWLAKVRILVVGIDLAAGDSFSAQIVIERNAFGDSKGFITLAPQVLPESHFAISRAHFSK